jgi:fructose-1-phosphate kinase PfkB-like protein
MVVSSVLAAFADADAIGLCGTFPLALGSDFYAAAARENPRATVLLDAYRDIDEVLDTGAVNVLKINEEEVRALASESDIAKAAGVCMTRGGLDWLGVTAGGGEAYLFGREASWRFRIPHLPVVVNPIGAGDTVSAIFLLHLREGVAPEQAFAHGLAAATASCQSMIGADFDKSEVQGILANVQITPTSSEAFS